MSMQTKTHNLKKKAAMVTVVILIVALTIGGTYMWNDFSQHKTNEASNEALKYNVKLIEDFQEKTNWVTTDGTLKKEIRVKNTGTDDSFAPVYARIQLKEYMEIRPMVIEKTLDRYMIDTSGAFIVFDTEAAAQAAYPNAPAVVELTDAVSGIHGWYIQTQAKDPNGQYGDFVTTAYGAGDVQHIVGNVRADADANKSEEHNTIANGEAPHRNGECDYPARDWTDFKGTNLIADQGTVYADGKFVNDSIRPNETAGYIRWLLANDYIITLSDWAADGVRPVSKWIIDDRALSQDGGLDGGRIADAWIYWGDAIAPGATTANFIDAVELKVQPDGNYYYAVHTEMEALSLEELGGDYPKWTDAPEEIIDAFNGRIDMDAEVVDAQNYRLTTAQTHDTADWIAVAKKMVRGQEYFLIVRTEVTGTSSFDTDWPCSNNYNSEDSELKTAIDSWYDSFASANSSSVLVTKAVTHNALTALGEDYTHGFNAAYNGFSLPAATPASAGAAGTAFPLSSDEAAAYMSVFWYDASWTNIYNTSDGTASGTAMTAYTNWEALADGVSAPSWLRSPYATNPNNAASLYANGSVGSNNVSNSRGVRLALWVTADIFKN